jgi:hypothetical protein
MAQLTNPLWEPQSNNPLPRCVTTVKFTAKPGRSAAGPPATVRITYKLRGSLVRFVLPSPGPAGSVVVSQTGNMLVDDHRGVADAFSVTRTLTLQASGHPALETLDVAVADLVNGVPVNEHSSSTNITFALGS